MRNGTPVESAFRAYMGVVRATINKVNDGPMMQEASTDMFNMHKRDEIESPQNYGFTSAVLPRDEQQQTKTASADGGTGYSSADQKGEAAEAIMMFPGGNQSHGIAVVMDDRRHRPRNLPPGASIQNGPNGDGDGSTDGKGNSGHTVSYIKPGTGIILGTAAKYASLRHFDKKKQPRPKKQASASGQAQTAPEEEYKHEGDTINTEVRTTKNRIEYHASSSPLMLVGTYDRLLQRWIHHTPKSDDGGDPTTAIPAQLSAMVSQVSALVGSGAGLPGINGLGSQIAALASSVTGAGSTVATSIATLGTSIAGGGMAGMSALLSSVTPLLSQLSGLMNPAGLTQALHEHIIDNVKGIISSAFSGQHKTEWNSGGVTHTSSTAVTSTAPVLPHNGEVLASDGLVLSKIMTAAGYVTASDARLKRNIADLPPSLDRLMQVEIKTFDKHFIAIDAAGKVSMDAGSISTLGVIAQDFRKIFPELVHENAITGFLEVNESKLAMITLAAFQQFVTETRAEIDGLKENMRLHR
jgi:hypothetical protein